MQSETAHPRGLLRKIVAPLLLILVLSSGCGSLMGRSEYGPQYPVYSGVAWDVAELSGAWSGEITDQTVVCTLLFLVDFPLTLAVDTAVFPIELAVWVFSGSDPDDEPATTPELKAPAPKVPAKKIPPPETPESIAHRWSVLRSLDGRLFFDKAFGHGALDVRCHARRIEIRPTRPQARAASGWETVPIETDRDAEDFYFRVTGNVHSKLRGKLSDAYRGFLRRRRR